MMKLKLIGLLFILITTIEHTQCQTFSQSEVWKAHWITTTESQSATDTWICFRKEIEVNEASSSAMVHIAVNSKYWLWINSRMVIFEGGLKRGPNPEDTYYDEVDIAPYLKQGKNMIAVLLWYFGKDGFSHNSSGKAGLVFQCITREITILSDQSWTARLNPAYELSPPPHPNYRLSESNIYYDARNDLGNWQSIDYDGLSHGFTPAVEIDVPPCAPWHKLMKRPIPQWKDYGLKNYVNEKIIFGESVDTIVCQLPYNAQITPYMKIISPSGKLIKIKTDDYAGGSALNVRAGYITDSGLQNYESYGWMNGNKVYYFILKGIKVLDLKYRETGYDTEFTGNFDSNDAFLNLPWKKQGVHYILLCGILTWIALTVNGHNG